MHAIDTAVDDLLRDARRASAELAGGIAPTSRYALSASTLIRSSLRHMTPLGIPVVPPV